MFSDDWTTRVETALYKAVKAYLALRQGEVSSSELYETFGGWHPSVTTESLNFGTGDNYTSVYWKTAADQDAGLLLRSAPLDLAR